MLTQPGPVLSYIGDRADGELANWQVLFAAVREKAGDIAITSELGFPLARQHRTAGLRSNSSSIFVSDKQRVASRGVERIGVPEDVARQAEEDYKPKKPTEGSINYPDRIYRYVRKTPLLIVHLLKIDGNRNPDAKSKKPAGNFDGIGDTVVAYSISFPDTATPEKTVEYVVNTTWIRENMGGDEEDDEPRDDDKQ